MRRFTEFVDRFDIVDLPLNVSEHPVNPSLCKIDKRLVSAKWEDKYRDSTTFTLPKHTFDHLS